MSALSDVLARLDEIKNPDPRLYEKPDGVAADMIAALDEARVLLRDLEVMWLDGGRSACPLCGAEIPTWRPASHVRSCRLGAALGREVKP